MFEYVECGHNLAAMKRWKSVGPDGVFCRECQRVFPVLVEKPFNPQQATPEARIANAIEVLMVLGGNKYAHHKQFALDQVLRVLTACPIDIKTETDHHGNTYTHEVMGESKLYQELVQEYSLEAEALGDDASVDHEGSWEPGIAP